MPGVGGHGDAAGDAVATYHLPTLSLADEDVAWWLTDDARRDGGAPANSVVAEATRAPAGEVRGVARSLDPDGGLRLLLECGAETVVRAGDLEAPPREARR